MEKAQSQQAAIVIGGGLVGICCALALQRQGIAVTLVDQPGERRSASWGNAGHIAVEQVEPIASRAMLRSAWKRMFWRGGPVDLPVADIAHWLPFALRLIAASRPRRFAAGKAALTGLMSQAIPAWRRLLASADASPLLVEDGHFVVWETPEGARAGRAAWANADTGTATFRDATSDELAMLARLTEKPPVDAIRFIGTARINDLGDLIGTLLSEFACRGGTLQTARVDALRITSGRATVTLDDGTAVRPDHIVVAAGAASGRLLGPLGHTVPLIAERGYHIQTADTDWPTDLPPVVFEERAMIVTRFRSGLRAASFVEFGRIDSPPDPRKWRRLRTHIAALGVSFPQVSEWIGARPTLPDYLPAIGKSRLAANLYYAFGHQHLGLTLAAITGEAVGAMVVDQDPQMDLAPFDIDRFA